MTENDDDGDGGMMMGTEDDGDGGMMMGMMGTEETEEDRRKGEKRTEQATEQEAIAIEAIK